MNLYFQKQKISSKFESQMIYNSDKNIFIEYLIYTSCDFARKSLLLWNSAWFWSNFAPELIESFLGWASSNFDWLTSRDLPDRLSLASSHYHQISPIFD